MVCCLLSARNRAIIGRSRYPTCVAHFFRQSFWEECRRRADEPAGSASPRSWMTNVDEAVRALFPVRVAGRCGLSASRLSASRVGMPAIPGGGCERVVRGTNEPVGSEEDRRVGGVDGSDTRGVGVTDGSDTGESASNVGGGAVTTRVGVYVSASGGVDTAEMVVLAGAMGGAGIGLLGVWLGWPLGVALIGWVAVPLMSAGTTLGLFCCCQAIVRPSDAITVAANIPITSTTRRARSPRTSSTGSVGIGWDSPASEDSAVSACVRLDRGS